jgi:Leucine-rich repeat (LRR) protein
MDKLDTLNLNNNKIEELGPRFFEGLPRVTSLKLDYNKIHNIDDEAFTGLEGGDNQWGEVTASFQSNLRRCPYSRTRSTASRPWPYGSSTS